MLESIRRFLKERFPAEEAETSAGGDQRALQLAAAVLLMEIVKADAQITDEERTVLRAGVQSTFGLAREAADALLARAEAESNQAVSLYEFTSLVDKGLSAEEKKRIVELMWLIAFADAEKHDLEEHLVRRVAGLLHVPHPDFIDAKLRAKERSGQTA